MEVLVQNRSTNRILLNRTVTTIGGSFEYLVVDRPQGYFGIESSTKFPVVPIENLVFYSLLRKLNELEAMGNNWDGYEALKPSLDAIEQARTFILKTKNLSLPFYYVSPSVNGEIILEFKAGSLAAEIYFIEGNLPELLLFEDNQCVGEGLPLTITDMLNFFN